MIERIDLSELDVQIEDKMIRVQNHPDDPNLLILNYTQDVQYGRLWNDFTKAARGLVVHGHSGEILARPFEKFFNVGEHQEGEIPSDEGYTVYEKMDGSLGILFNYEGEWIWATRGSFTSDQVGFAKEMFANEGYSYDDLDTSYTHLFEIIHVENRIVVDYGGNDRLVSLGSIHTKTGVEIGPNPLFPIPKKYDLKFDELHLHDESNFEGFVVKFDGGFRVKVKLEEYVQLHRIIFGLSTLSIWTVLQENTYENLLSSVPEEFQPWIKETASKLLEKFHSEMYQAYSDYNSYTDLDDRKVTALNYQRFGSEPYAARFAILDGKDPSDIIWKSIRPEFKTIQ